MASDSEVEATCSVCLDLYREPVTLGCGHSFCRGCILRYWGSVGGRPLPCPVCRAQFAQPALRRNWLLTHRAESARKLGRSPSEPPRRQRDRGAPGPNCPGSASPHTTRLPEEQREAPPGAVALCQESLRGTLLALQKQMEAIFECQSEGKADCLRANIAGEFAKLHQFLNEERQALLLRLAQKEVAALRELEGNAREASAQRASLNQTIADIQQRLRVHGTGPLEVSVTLEHRQTLMGLTLKAYRQYVLISIQSRCRVKEGRQDGIFETYRDYKWTGRMYSGYISFNDNSERQSSSCPDHGPPVSTPHPSRVRRPDPGDDLREPQRAASGWPGEIQRLPQRPGVRGFRLGEALLGGGGWGQTRHGTWGWPGNLSGARSSSPLETKNGVWAVALWFGEYIALSSPRTCLPLRAKPKKLGIYLDYAAGQISMYDADAMTHLYTFSDHFTEKMYPYFNTYCTVGSLRVTLLQI
ncbi:E3 ubiquitin-protein ligase TRIM39-like [Cetorhinus maximus]